ncbi:MAG: peptidase MA family metallohydrolase [bacterium]|nr:peptidase MA family metallohydrolase [bacterium]
MRQFTTILCLVSLMVGAGVVATPPNIPTPPIEREHFTYFLSNPSQIDLADSVLNLIRVRTTELLNTDLPYKPSVHVVDNADRFKQLTRGLIPDWGAAAAFPERKLIAIKSPDKFSVGRSLAELLAHEYAHLALDHRCGFNDPPRWVNEGSAMYLSTEWSWSNNLTMSRSAVFGQLVPLREIELVNRFESDKAQVAYAESYLAVQYFLDEYGVGSFNTMLDQIAQGKSFDAALAAGTGSNQAEFELEFSAFLEKRYNLVSLFMDTMLFWVGLALIVLIGTFLRYKKRRQYYKKWEEEEKYQSTDFDYGDADNPEQTDDDEPWRS